ncbi:cupin domain-containing protein [Paraglaciecola marina]|uniref:cupin domain-containing protein n=1 Tax=Paraglaciecola marina TaxID=2500157 RepID=UPI001061849E|nr:cupin domain-containing protein [Paraglaciecola marina]
MTTNTIVKQANEGDWLDVLGMKVQFLSTSKDTQNRYSSMLNTVPKGKGAPPHCHPWDESFYILKGDIELCIGAKKHHLSTGDYALIPAGQSHAFTGLSEEEGLMILFDSPSHSQAFFQEINDTIKSIPQDLQKMPAIGDRHKVSFL